MAPIAVFANGQNGQTNGHPINGKVALDTVATPVIDPTAARRLVDAVTVNGQFTSYSVMLVGLGGNNGTTLVATVLANRHNVSWNTRDGVQTPNYIGSMFRASTMRLGPDAETGVDVNIPMSDILPTVHPNDLVVSGWDISGMPLDKAMRRAKVLEWDLQRQLQPLMAEYTPLPSVYYPDFINANQEERADNVLPGTDKQAHLDQIRKDIREFKAAHGLESIIVLWTANTERYSELIPGINDTAANLEKAVRDSHEEVSPSTLFAMASIYEGVPYINGAPQNSFVPGCIELATQHKAFVGGDDFKSGQTKIKSCLAEFLVQSGIKPLSIASYNHLGNNDGRNLNAQKTFRSKEISKSSVVDDMVESNHLLYKPLDTPKGEQAGVKARKTEHPDHCVVIKYMPAAGDDKVALDEYYSELAMGGRNKMTISNTCQDSLLAMPLIFDLVILTELLTRVQYRRLGDNEFETLYSVLSLLSSMLKAPLVRPGEAVVNGASRQRAAVESFLKALIGLPMLTEWEKRKMLWD